MFVTAGRIAVAACCLGAGGMSSAAEGQAPSGYPQASIATAKQDNSERIQSLINSLAEQNSRLARQARDIARQQQELEEQRVELERLKQGLALQRESVEGTADPFTAVAISTQRAIGKESAESIRATGSSTTVPIPVDGDQKQVAQSNGPSTQQPQTSGPSSGDVEQRSRPQDLDILANVGGVLTPKGRLVFEPQFEYSHTSLNRFFFQGVEIVDAVLIGVIEATDSDRDTFTPGLGVRYGITNRLEVDARGTYVVRSDRVTNTEISSGTNNVQDLSGSDIGDVELGAHYQINQGGGEWPFFVGNLRVKTITGTGPFDVARDANGIETELATGSGFWAIEPSLSVIHQSDPAVLFGNIGYLYNIPADIDQVIGGAQFGKVDPGDSINASFGIGISLNERTSISLGYQHSYVLGTKTEINGVVSTSNALQVGSLLFGMSYSISNNIGLNLNVAAGLTEDAPDARVSIKVPIAFTLF